MRQGVVTKVLRFIRQTYLSRDRDELGPWSITTWSNIIENIMVFVWHVPGTRDGRGSTWTNKMYVPILFWAPDVSRPSHVPSMARLRFGLVPGMAWLFSNYVPTKYQARPVPHLAKARCIMWINFILRKPGPAKWRVWFRIAPSELYKQSLFVL